MKKTLIALMMAGSLLAGAQTVSKRDKKFMECTAAHGLYEVKTAQLAQTKALTPEVKALGKTLEEHRNNANDGLKTIAAKRNVALPTALSKKQQKCYDKLAKKEGKKFDKCYANSMAKCHKKEVCKFKKEAKKTDDAELKSFATAAVPTLQQHRQLAKDACAAVKK